MSDKPDNDLPRYTWKRDIMGGMNIIRREGPYGQTEVLRLYDRAEGGGSRPPSKLLIVAANALCEYLSEHDDELPPDAR